MEFLIVAGIIIFAVVFVLLLSRKAREETVGICNYALEQSVAKGKNKQKILELLGKESLSNEQIREVLRISERSVVRYMDELEKEGKVKQTGTTGRSVRYVLQGR